MYDDIDLDVGKLRIRQKGSAGGHNGMKNIIQHVGSQEFVRIRVGVGKKPDHMDLADYVLSRFGKEDLANIRESFVVMPAMRWRPYWRMAQLQL